MAIMRAYLPCASNPLYFEDQCIISIPFHFPDLIPEIFVRDDSISKDGSLRQAAPRYNLGDLSFDEKQGGDDQKNREAWTVDQQHCSMRQTTNDNILTRRELRNTTKPASRLNDTENDVLSLYYA